MVTHLSCDATFNENCDPSRDYTDIGSVRLSFEISTTFTNLILFQLLDDNGASDTLDFMKQVSDSRWAPVLLDLTYDDGSTGLTSMEIMKNFGRLVAWSFTLLRYWIGR